MMYAGVKKQALNMQRRFKIDEFGLYNDIKQNKKGCSVCQACNPDNHTVKGEAQWTPIPDQPILSVAIDFFSMSEVHIGKEVFDCLVLCVDRHSGYIVAVPACKKGLLAKEVAVKMIRHLLTVLGVPRTSCSDCGPQLTGGWLLAMCSLMGIHHAKSSPDPMAELKWLKGSCLGRCPRSTTPTRLATNLRRCRDRLRSTMTPPQRVAWGHLSRFSSAGTPTSGSSLVR